MGASATSSNARGHIAARAPRKMLPLFSAAGRDTKSPLTVNEQVQSFTKKRKIAMTNRIVAATGGDVDDKIIGVLGVTFKPSTDDLREVPSLVVLPRFLGLGTSVQVCDPDDR
jgi:UDPglucose 6-dehydrogenase